MTVISKTQASILEVDFHGCHPDDITEGPLAKILEQAWEQGAKSIRFIHGHGRNRGISPGRVNTNTGYLSLCIRSALRHDESLRRWIKHTTLDCSHEGSTSVKLKANPNPTRSDFHYSVFPERRWSR
jgi:hypothetical protein